MISEKGQDRLFCCRMDSEFICHGNRKSAYFFKILCGLVMLMTWLHFAVKGSGNM